MEIAGQNYKKVVKAIMIPQMSESGGYSISAASRAKP